MAERVSSLRIPKLIGRLNQIQYIPVRDVDKGKHKQKNKESPDWFDYLVHNYKSKKCEAIRDQDNIPLTYVGVRHPPSLKKAEPVSGISSPRSKEVEPEEKDANNLKNSYDEETLKDIKSPKLLHLMGVDTTSDHNTPTSALHLPQIMKSFLPGVSRKAPVKTVSSSQQSSWTNLTSRRKIKQVAPNSYNPATKPKSFPRRVTLFTVNYDSNSSKRLKRRPLPPLLEASQTSNLHPNAPPPVWLPSVSQRPRSPHDKDQEKKPVSKTTVQIQEAKVKALNSLLGRIEKSKNLTIPHDTFKKVHVSNHPPKVWESNSTNKILKSRRRPRRENDRQFGVRGGIVLNKLPSDLIGDLQSNYHNLEFYLGKVNEPRVKNDKTVYIPTGAREGGSTPASAKKRHSLIEFQGKSDVKMKYAHRGSDDTPPLDLLPWENNAVPTNCSPPDLERITTLNQKSTDSKAKRVKRVTINMPKVPPPSPESNPGRTNRRRKAALSQQQYCRFCNEKEIRRAEVRFPEISAKLPPLVTDHLGRAADAEPRLGNSHSKVDPPKRSEAAVKLEERAKLIDNLVNAHGEMKRRHKCPPKEVVIAPFKVTIEEDSKLETKKSLLKTEEKLRLNRSTVSKPFTFSYIPPNHLKHHRKKHQLKSYSEPKPPPPEVFNHPSRPHPLQHANNRRPIISSFVSANQAKEIYEALINESQNSTTNNNPAESLNKATDCDGLNENFSQPHWSKGHELVSESILSQCSSFTEQAKQVIVA